MDEESRGALEEIAGQAAQINKTLQRIAESLELIAGEIDNGRFNPPKR